MKIKLLLAAIIMLIVSSGISEAKSKIGVFDSRLIAINNFRSESFQKEMQAMFADYKKAKENKDTAEIKKLDEKGPLMQRILHDKGFGRGSVAEIMERNSTELKALAKKEKLSAIVSKWELIASGEDVEVVDITLLILKEIYKAPEDVLKMYDEMKDMKPVENAFFLSPND